jgi:UDP-2,4-diacetamido-2,4,6-trideoxy-beta-L-altropyranose hydrolase
MKLMAEAYRRQAGSCDGWHQDAEETSRYAKDISADWVIVDHYGIDARWEEVLARCGGEIMVIDDIANRPHRCRLLLDQNLGRSAVDYSKQVPRDCVTLIGPQYALLRPEFASLRESSLRRRANGAVRRLLISMGGADLVNATEKVLTALASSPLQSDLSITVVMGTYAPALEEIQSMARRMRQPISVVVDAKNMAELMADSDLAVGAAGTTSWERCCLGLPAFVAVIADNQLEIASALQKAGAVRLFRSTDDIGLLQSELSELIKNKEGIGEMSRAAALITDGRGTARVVNEILRADA